MKQALYHSPMRVTCLINHFNYGNFIGEAVASVLAQTHPLDEIVLVDDGSDPEHLGQAQAAANQSTKVQLIAQSNGGQLSCFQAGLNASDGELVFFLDADDRWDPTYVEHVLELLKNHPEIDFVATNNLEFSDGCTVRIENRPSRDRGYSVVLCLEKGGAWGGGGGGPGAPHVMSGYPAFDPGQDLSHTRPFQLACLC